MDRELVGKARRHLLEWEQSGVDEQLTRLNVIPLNGRLALDYLLYAEALPRRNDGRISDQLLKRYEHAEQGGWWCSGMDLLTGEPDTWGCFKPDRPRLDADKRKPIKYEHPPKVPTGLFALRVPPHIWQRIADRHNLGIQESDIDRTRPDFGFWPWLLAHPEIPLCITEGAKKAGALLTAGFAAVALPGINSGYRTPKDEEGNRTGRSRLLPQLKKLAGDREILIAFDSDAKPATVKAVEAAIRKLGYLLQQAGCRVKVLGWPPEDGKGVDDLIARQGQPHFERIYHQALPLDIWKAQSWTKLSYSPNVALNCRYLPDLAIPETARLVGIKSPKGTGKPA
ncbi:MAG: DUF3854 domain-containing protein, partial [Chloroflexaceae bacterium]|nr:DUF3854 domain-containing protein [Chloroflexaceae bacterium]